MNKRGYWGYALFVVILAIILLVIAGMFMAGKKSDKSENVNSSNLNISGNSSAGIIMDALKEKDPELCESLQPEMRVIQCKIKVYNALKDKSYCVSLKNNNLTINMQFGNKSIVASVADFCEYQYSLINKEEYCDVSNDLKTYCLEAAKR